MPEIIRSEHHKDFYDVLKTVYKNISIPDSPPSYYEVKDAVLEYTVDNNIEKMQFEGMLKDSEDLIMYYLEVAMNICNLVYKIDGRVCNSYSQRMFEGLEHKNIYPIRR